MCRGTAVAHFHFNTRGPDMGAALWRTDWVRRISDMRQAKRVNTTLGELILAVTEEVAPLKADRTTSNALVSYIVQDMFVKGCVRLKRKSHLREIVEMNVAA